MFSFFVLSFWSTPGLCCQTERWLWLPGLVKMPALGFPKHVLWLSKVHCSAWALFWEEKEKKDKKKRKVWGKFFKKWYFELHFFNLFHKCKRVLTTLLLWYCEGVRSVQWSPSSKQRVMCLETWPSCPCPSRRGCPTWVLVHSFSEGFLSWR